MKKGKKQSEVLKLISNPDTEFVAKEAYKTLRTNLIFALKGRSGRCVAISSSMPGEGKSSICANLGIALADMDARVLIIDGDLRKPRQHKIFGVNNRSGLSSLIAGLTDMESSCKKKVHKGLDIITAGPIPPNPSELLCSDQFKEILKEISEDYDYILIDTPPIGVVTDALVLPADSTDIILVCKVGNTTYDQYGKSVASIEMSGMNLIGTIMNGVGIDSKGYGKAYKKYEYK